MDVSKAVLVIAKRVRKQFGNDGGPPTPTKKKNTKKRRESLRECRTMSRKSGRAIKIVELAIRKLKSMRIFAVYRARNEPEWCWSRVIIPTRARRTETYAALVPLHA